MSRSAIRRTTSATARSSPHASLVTASMVRRRDALASEPGATAPAWGRRRTTCNSSVLRHKHVSWLTRCAARRRTVSATSLFPLKTLLRLSLSLAAATAARTPVAKPVADVINLSLGSPAGDPAAANSRAVNNAALAGTIVVASAGNSGPGLGTVGNPGAATMAIGVAASLDPGSVAGSDVLAPGQIPLETRAPAAPGPSPEMGRSSNLNVPQSGERQGMRIFPWPEAGRCQPKETPASLRSIRAPSLPITCSSNAATRLESHRRRQCQRP